jgi:hypothetical protein
MDKKMTEQCVTEEAQRMARQDRGRARLDQLCLPYPGGDDCPARVVRGLQKLRRQIEQWVQRWDPEYPWDDDERAALDWIDMWLDAGAVMLPGEDS